MEEKKEEDARRRNDWLAVHGGQSGRCQPANWQPCRFLPLLSSTLPPDHLLLLLLRVSLSPRFCFPVYPNIFSPEERPTCSRLRSTPLRAGTPTPSSLSPPLPFTRLRVARGRVKRNGQPDGKSVYVAKEREEGKEDRIERVSSFVTFPTNCYEHHFLPTKRNETKRNGRQSRISK